MMKITKSIRWRLQIWYGIILVFVLTGLGLTAYRINTGREFHRVDDELHRRFSLVMDGMHPHGRPHDGFPPSGDIAPADAPPEVSPPPNGGPDDFFRDQPHRHRDLLDLPPRAAFLFDTNQNAGEHFFLLIRDRDGHTVEQRGLVPEHLDVPLISSTNGGHPFAGPEPPMINLEGQYRVLVAAVPGDETVVIGCSIAAEATELNQSALVLTLVGLGILLFGLAGGWWIVSQALRPIVEISQTAEKISSGDLAQRINVAETESELGQLAAVLNSTFARLEGAFAQQQQFTADAAHELRTPVAVIITQTQMALGRDRAAADYKATLEACQRAAQRMRRLIESLLELARFDAGQQHLKRAPFDVAVTAGESLQLVQPLAEQQNVKIISEFSPTPITGDPERIGQVLLNLLTNAIQYNRPGGEVRVSVRTENSMALITVSDTGPGISPEDLPRVTERFYRADQSRSTGGSGLGLSICQAIIAAHGGTLEISSELNRGTTAVLRLPVNKK